MEVVPPSSFSSWCLLGGFLLLSWRLRESRVVNPRRFWWRWLRYRKLFRSGSWGRGSCSEVEVDRWWCCWRMIIMRDSQGVLCPLLTQVSCLNSLRCAVWVCLSSFWPTQITIFSYFSYFLCFFCFWWADRNWRVWLVSFCKLLHCVGGINFFYVLLHWQWLILFLLRELLLPLQDG